MNTSSHQKYEKSKCLISQHELIVSDRAVCKHTHEHTHEHQSTKSVINRLAKAIGHLEMVKKMVEDGRDCSDVLIQLAAVRSAINNTGKVILKDHIENCIVDAIEEHDDDAINKLSDAIDQFIK